jgi:hypothetical protein
MTKTEERIAELEREVDRLIDGRTSASADVIALEIRALRLMLQEEIREATLLLRRGRRG